MIDVTVPSIGALISFITFIASTIHNTCPAFTLVPTSTYGLAVGELDA